MKGILLSIVLHLGVFVFLIWKWPSSQSPQGAQPPLPEIQLVFKEDIEQSFKKQKKKDRKKAKRKKKGFRAQDFSLSPLGSNKSDFQKNHFNHGGADLSKPDDPSANWGEGGAEFGRIQDYSMLERVAYRMDALVEYPYTLAYHHIGGVVRVRLVVGKTGKCHWGKTKILGNSPELRFYILTVLKVFCRGDFWHRLKKRGSSNIDFSFNFNTYDKKRESVRVLGNVVTYNLPGYQDRGVWRVGPVQGYLIAPTVLLNTTWIVENWNRLVHDEDPLDAYRPKEKED